MLESMGWVEMKAKFGVPGSKLKEKIKDVEIYCTSEEEAMALAAGAWLAGKQPEVYMQNTGLCRSLNIILTLYKPYKIPLPKLLLSNRKYPFHHYYVWKYTEDLLRISKFKKIERIEDEENKSN